MRFTQVSVRREIFYSDQNCFEIIYFKGCVRLFTLYTETTS